MPVKSMNISMDDALKRNFNQVCAEMGMSASTAISIFAKTVIRRRALPFIVTGDMKPEDIQNRHRAFGALARYANPELIDKEKGAWTRAAARKHEMDTHAPD
ncbi:hypothetical protein AGMMS50256_23750 [Betaproteobacteria bacterium]|nr:hypothetical protein AGMMS50256_23750 [Betaproteobacteria bacterium]